MDTTRKPRVVLIPTARATFATDTAGERAAAARDLLVELGADVAGPTELVMTTDDVESAACHVDPAADVVINACASFSDATPALRLYQRWSKPVVLWAFREPGPVGDRLWLNSLCGANLFGHALVRSGGSARLLYGDPAEAGVRHALSQVLQGKLPVAPAVPTAQRQRADPAETRNALARLRRQRIGLIGDAPPGFTPCEYDPNILRRLFGITVTQLDVDTALALVRSVDDDSRVAERKDARANRPSLNRLDPTEVNLAAAVTSALRGWREQQALAALALRCWPEFPTELGVCPCSALSRLADEGTATACERDVYGAVTMLLLEALGSGTTYLVDTVDLDAERNVVRAWHCGSAATRLAADPAKATQDVHCNRKIGVAGNFALKTGRVVLARLADDPDPGNTTGLRMLITSGESLPEHNRFHGNTAAIRLDADAENFVHGLVAGGFPHHTVLAWTDVRPRLRSAADLLGIPVVEW